MKKYIFLIIICILCSNIYAYPDLGSIDIKHSDLKNLVYSIPEEYYQYVEYIEFAGNNIEFHGYAMTKWDQKHNCYDGKIFLWNKLSYKVLLHELGHIYEYCVLKKSYSSEEYANNFKIQR